MGTESLVWLGTPNGAPKGLMVFLHGSNQMSDWHKASSGGGKSTFWRSVLDVGWAALAIKSPGASWDVDPYNKEHVHVMDVAQSVRTYHLGDANIATAYIGFSAGAGAASMCGFEDPSAIGCALLGSGGRVAAAAQTQLARPVYHGHGLADPKVSVSVHDAMVARWREETRAIIRYDRFPRVQHSTSVKYLGPMFDHLGVK